MQRLKALAGGANENEAGNFRIFGNLQEMFQMLHKKPFFLGGFMKIIAYTEPTESGLLIHYPTKEIKEEILHLYQTSKEKYNGYFKIDIQKPYPNRTTGEGSQNNKFYALVTEICKETGNDIEDVKEALKEKAIKRGYPYKINKLTGRIRPASTTEVNTLEMGYLIDEAIQECAELGIQTE